MSQSLRRSLVTFVLTLAIWSLALTVCSFAFESEVTSSPVGLSCAVCHGGDSLTTSTTVGPGSKGPHGGYTTGTTKCASCHYTHDAPTDFRLMPEQTIEDTCEMCHDGTGGDGVYGVIKARTGSEPASGHRIGVTNRVPAGTVATVSIEPSTTSAEMTSTRMTFAGENGYLTCSDCHSPHDNDTVAPFPGDRLRSGDGTVAVSSNRLLRRRPGGSPVSVDTYGSGWCAACHGGATQVQSVAGRMGNHSVQTESVGISYSNVARVKGVETTETEMGPLGGSNFGYVMPYPRTEDQAGKRPICQQCHEDGRHVGDDLSAQFTIDSSALFNVTEPNGVDASDTPRFQTFPHESDVGHLLVETGDDLCLNCHPK